MADSSIPQIDPKGGGEAQPCLHRYLTSYGKGWECADCGVGILSLAVPIPMPLVVEALKAIAAKDHA